VRGSDCPRSGSGARAHVRVVMPRQSAIRCTCGLTTGCSGRSAARPAAEPERYLGETAIKIDEQIDRNRSAAEPRAGSLKPGLAQDSKRPSGSGRIEVRANGGASPPASPWGCCGLAIGGEGSVRAWGSDPRI